MSDKIITSLSDLLCVLNSHMFLRKIGNTQIHIIDSFSSWDFQK